MATVIYLHKLDGRSVELVPTSLVKTDDASLQQWAIKQASTLDGQVNVITIEKNGSTVLSGELADGCWEWKSHA